MHNYYNIIYPKGFLSFFFYKKKFLLYLNYPLDIISSTGDATNTGWISASNFGTWAKQAANDPEIKWDGGMFTWQLSSDISGFYINDYIARK